MLAPLIVDLLVASFVMLLVGWLIDTIHTSTHYASRGLHSVGLVGCENLARGRVKHLHR
jgi:hypothetical protein